MFSQERQNAIRKIVRERRRINFADLQSLVAASPATLRRDLSELEKAGEVVRVHGGVLDPRYVRAELSFDERLLQHGRSKRLIGELAATLVPSGASVFIDAGSTCLEAGKLLLGRPDVRIFSHSATLVAASAHARAPFVCLGGELRQVSGAFIGARALGALRTLHVDIAFLGVTGLDPKEGCSTTEISEAEMKATILTRATRRAVLADSSKWMNPSTVYFAPWSEVHDWVTDKLPEAATCAALRIAGVRLHETSEPDHSRKPKARPSSNA